MKIYTWERGWRGSSVVVANSKEEAAEYLLANTTVIYDVDFDKQTLLAVLVEHEITVGFIHDDFGDI